MSRAGRSLLTVTGAAIVMGAGLLATPAIAIIWLHAPAGLADLAVAYAWAGAAGAVAALGVLLIQRGGAK